MKRLIPLCLAFALPATAALATDLNLSAESSGSNAITVVPGELVNYEVVGELGDNLSQGLAFFRLDLSFDGGPLPQADDPTAAPMTSFDRPSGVTNPAGFGGTEVNGDLIQIGGAMNTVNSSFAPFPNGSVTTGIAQPSSAEVLVRGTLTAPKQVGSYTLSIADVDANVIRLGETGIPFWAVEQAGAGAITNLTIEVSALSTQNDTVSISNPAPVTLDLHAGSLHGGRNYWLIGTAAGTSPGILLTTGLTLPINPDAYTDFTIAVPNSATLQNNVGSLSPFGTATSTFNLRIGVNAHLAGVQVHHAFVTISQDFHSEAVVTTLVP